MPIDARQLDRRLTLLRSASTDDGTATVADNPEAAGTVWASKADVSDGERIRAAAQGQEVTTRFVVRSTALTRTITGKDRIVCDGLAYEVTGTKEMGRRAGIEITASAQPDITA